MLCDLDATEAGLWRSLLERSAAASALVNLTSLEAVRTWAPHIARFSFLLSPANRTAQRTPTTPTAVPSAPEAAMTSAP
ncbi:hypothetical protein [uncultured Friedmanniella sp.]|uniref:hypothetical protein n=1 Tax=uncultured Friedmanniella sp. TaxID=335381 RepID=UPI0035CAFCCE